MLGFTKLFVIALLSLSFSVCADNYSKQKIYKFVDKQGRVSFSDKPKHDGYVKLEKTRKGWTAPNHYSNYKENKRKYEQYVITASKKHQVPVWLISAVIHAESFYNPSAVSRAGAVGLMQLMPGTAKNYGVYDRQDPRQNIEGGVKYLKDLLIMFNGDTRLALAAYNAGENAVKKYGNRIPPYKETQHYVKKVSALSVQYKSQAI
jgi:soluble lytic murein transglycosylase-like protein